MFLSYHLISLRIIIFVKTLEKHKQEGYRLLENLLLSSFSFVYVRSLLTFPLPSFLSDFIFSLCHFFWPDCRTNLI